MRYINSITITIYIHRIDKYFRLLLRLHAAPLPFFLVEGQLVEAFEELIRLLLSIQVSKIFQMLSESHTTFPNSFRRFPKISEDFRGTSEEVWYLHNPGWRYHFLVTGKILVFHPYLSRSFFASFFASMNLQKKNSTNIFPIWTSR